MTQALQVLQLWSAKHVSHKQFSQTQKKLACMLASHQHVDMTHVYQVLHFSMHTSISLLLNSYMLLMEACLLEELQVLSLWSYTNCFSKHRKCTWMLASCQSHQHPASFLQMSYIYFYLIFLSWLISVCFLKVVFTLEHSLISSLSYVPKTQKRYARVSSVALASHHENYLSQLIKI